MYKKKVCVLYWCPYGSYVINGLEWQHGFELFLHFDINGSLWNFPKRKTTDKFIMHVKFIFLKIWDEHFFKKFFCNLTNCVQIIAKKRLGLLLFSRDGRVIAKIHFFFILFNLARRAQPSTNKLLHKSFTIFTQLQSIIFFSAFNCSPILKKVFFFNTFQQNIKCMNNIIRKAVLAPLIFKAPTPWPILHPPPPSLF